MPLRRRRETGEPVPLAALWRPNSRFHAPYSAPGIKALLYAMTSTFGMTFPPLVYSNLTLIRFRAAMGCHLTIRLRKKVAAVLSKFDGFLEIR